MLKSSTPASWQKALLIMFALLSFFTLAFWQTWQSMISIWSRSDTFAHGFLVMPASLWLIWGRKAFYRQLQPQPSYLGIFALLICGFAWLAANLSNALVVEQFALVGMLVCLVWSMLGNQVFVSMLFPLLFLFLMVPFGEDFVPFLMEYTATFVVGMLRLTGMSVYREGLHFTLTSGNWSVVEACSGIRYLIASFTLGLVYSYLSYTSYTKRGIFILASILVPILANGLRAYMIVMIGHLSGMKLATGVDHIIYGWVFFGLVMLLLFYIGSFWQDRVVDTAQHANFESINNAAGSIDLKWASAMAVCGFLVWPFAADELHARQAITASIPPALLQNLSKTVVEPDWQWQPHFTGAAVEKHYFVAEDGVVVGLYFANFGDESAGGELVNSQNNLIRPEQKQWRIVTQTSQQVLWPGQTVAVEETAIAGIGQDFLIMRWYRVGKSNTANGYYAKWLQLLKRLSGDATPELMMVIYTPTPHNDYSQARARLQKIALACCG